MHAPIVRSSIPKDFVSKFPATGFLPRFSLNEPDAQLNANMSQTRNPCKKPLPDDFLWVHGGREQQAEHDGQGILQVVPAMAGLHCYRWSTQTL